MATRPSARPRSPRRLLTADEFYDQKGWRPRGIQKYELIKGRVVVSEPQPGAQHGQVQVKLGMLLAQYVLRHRLGVVVVESGSVIERDPDTVVGPDISFVRAERLGGMPVPERHFPFAPDLAVEIRSPSDRKGKEEARVARLLDNGVRLVWHVEPRHRRATIHAPGAAPEPLGENDCLDGRDVVPGFRCPLRDALDW